uniref:Uncharacterized protein n=1 Tax=Titanophycus setchellii TaxID=940129 RepID=A0A1G4NYH4_9FLOR|nr:Hypothetical protein ORF_11 [Titanophycus setchellii]SCW23674.1 Hypothetical protein ORF_11 [Titanophycus setchellii]
MTVNILISSSLDHLYYHSSLETSLNSLDFVLLTNNTFTKLYAYFLLTSFSVVHSNDDFFLQVKSYNTRAISLYFWLGYSLIVSIQVIGHTRYYLKLKSSKSKTKNYHRRYLIY